MDVWALVFVSNMVFWRVIWCIPFVDALWKVSCELYHKQYELMFTLITDYVRMDMY